MTTSLTLNVTTAPLHTREFDGQTSWRGRDVKPVFNEGADICSEIFKSIIVRGVGLVAIWAGLAAGIASASLMNGVIAGAISFPSILGLIYCWVALKS